ncbi:20716_t:CDS:2, partial [Gigaspora margarita]
PSHEVLIGYRRIAEMDISIRTELNDLGLEKKVVTDASCQSYPLETQEEEAIDLYIDMPVLDAYYGLDKPVEKPLNNTGFGSNKKQDNNLEGINKKKQNRAKEIEVRCHYQDEIEVKIDKLYKWCFEIDPGGLCWQKLQLKKIRKEKLVGNNNNNNNGVKKSIKRRGSLVPSMDNKALDKINHKVLWNRRLQISYKKMVELSELDREVIQNIGCPKNNESIDAADIDNEIVNHLFDQGGKYLHEHLLNAKNI